MNSPYGTRRREMRAINSRNLSWSESDYSDVDYLTARGMSGSPLGSVLERLKFGMDRSAYGQCIDLLSEKFSRRMRHPARKSLMHAAVREYMDDQCVVCAGREMDKGDGANRCHACKGTGVRTLTAAERARMSSVAVGTWHRHEPDYLILLDCLRSAVGAHRRGMGTALADPADTDT